MNPSSVTRIHNGAPHDWERHSDFLNTMCMDLYGKPKSVYKYFVKFMRAMHDNDGPVIMVGGCGTPDKQVIANMGYSIMWGVDAYNQFPKRGHSDRRFSDECKRAFKYMEYTGVGDLMAAWTPQKRVAILWDRSGLIHSIRNGLWGFRGSEYDVKVQNMCFVKNLQTDIMRVLGDFATGEVLLFGGETELSIGSGQIKHFYFGDREGIEPAANRRVSRTTSISYSASPGKDLVAYATRRDRSPTASAPKRERLRDHKYIAVLTDKGKEDKRSDQRVTGDIGIYNALQDRDAIKAEFIWDLKPATLRDFDVVIVPNIGSGVRPRVMQDGWEKNVRDYVLAGGAAVLIHHAVGYVPCDFPAFPEVGKNAIDGVVVLQDMRIAAAHPVTDASSKLRRFPERATNPAFQAQLDATAFKVEQTFRAGFIDYVPLSPGPNGKVLAKSVVQEGKGGDPILIVGKAGKGKVLLSGIGLGEGGDFNEKGRYIRREGAVKAEENLLVNMAYWLTER